MITLHEMAETGKGARVRSEGTWSGEGSPLSLGGVERISALSEGAYFKHPWFHVARPLLG